eukprot:1160444-Pelagomonas_calceolata.AAC.10
MKAMPVKKGYVHEVRDQSWLETFNPANLSWPWCMALFTCNVMPPLRVEGIHGGLALGILFSLIDVGSASTACLSCCLPYHPDNAAAAHRGIKSNLHFCCHFTEPPSAIPHKQRSPQRDQKISSAHRSSTGLPRSLYTEGHSMVTAPSARNVSAATATGKTPPPPHAAEPPPPPSSKTVAGDLVATAPGARNPAAATAADKPPLPLQAVNLPSPPKKVAEDIAAAAPCAQSPAAATETLPLTHLPQAAAAAAAAAAAGSAVEANDMGCPLLPDVRSSAQSSKPGSPTLQAALSCLMLLEAEWAGAPPLIECECTCLCANAAGGRVGRCASFD